MAQNSMWSTASVLFKYLYALSYHQFHFSYYYSNFLINWLILLNYYILLLTEKDSEQFTYSLPN